MRRLLKLLSYFLPVLMLAVAGCDKNSTDSNQPFPNEPSTKEGIEIIKILKPQTLTDLDSPDAVAEWGNKNLIVYSETDLPVDPFGFDSEYSRIDFDNEMLILSYLKTPREPNSFGYKCYKDLTDGFSNYQLSVNLKGGLSQTIFLTRYSMLVPKVTSKTEVTVTVN